MAQTKTLLIGVKQLILDAVTGTGASALFGLPSRACFLAWQTSFDVNPAAVSITVRVSLDGVSWTVIDTSTAVGGETRTIDLPTAAFFVDVNVATNTGDRAVSVNMVAKAAA
jgi:hypothetical protein